MSNLVKKAKFKRSQILHITDNGVNLNGNSGIRATIFGATGFMGPYIGQILGRIGSDVVFPHQNHRPYNDEVKELKLCATSGMSYIQPNMDFNDLDMLDRVIQNSNVVINLVGTRQWKKKISEYEDGNIKVAQRIAQACQRNPNVIRLIHMSSTAADPKSESMDYKTKWYGEQEVRDNFENATILRCSSVYGMDDYFVRLFYDNFKFFYNYVLVPDNCEAKRQPIFVGDVAQAVLNALKMKETIGKTYELGGPHVLSNLQCYEILYNNMGRPPKLAYFNRDLLLKATQSLVNWEHFNYENIIKHSIDNHCQYKEDGVGSINDLYVKPVSFQFGADPLIADLRARVAQEKQMEQI